MATSVAKKKSKEVTVALGLAIKELRAKVEISQEELAHKAGLDRGYMGAVERGSYNLTLKNIVKVCDALEIKPSLLLKTAEKYWETE